jgi:tRNA (cmo5U34)-methyltransferase
MIRRSIPQLDVMRDAVLSVATPYVKPATDIIDLGCSDGAMLAAFVARFQATAYYAGIELSEPMIEAARQRFTGMPVRIQRLDLRERFPDCSASVILSVLTLMFTPIEYRAQIVQNVYDHLQPGGAFILVEKLLMSTAGLQRVFTDRYYQMKRDNGYTQEEIDRKRLALEGVQVPVTASWNEQLLHDAGFRQAECFWRWFNFAGWIAVKEG